MDGDVGAIEPPEWLTSAICEEFACPPDVAGRQDPSLCKSIMALRRYREAKHKVETAESQKDLDGEDYWIQKVFEVVIHRQTKGD